MTTFTSRIPTEQPSAVTAFITEAFTGATIAVVAVLGVMTWALAI
jgi:hypothetical protein